MTVNINAYREVSRDATHKLVEVFFEGDGYPVGDGTFRPSDLWSLPVNASVAQEIARYLDETNTHVETKQSDGQAVKVLAATLTNARKALAAAAAEKAE